MKTWKEFTDPMPRIVTERAVALETTAGWVVVETMAPQPSAWTEAALDILREMASKHCEKFTGSDTCFKNGRVAFAQYGADAACWPCIARRGIEAP